jgi:hypothetical protein
MPQPKKQKPPEGGSLFNKNRFGLFFKQGSQFQQLFSPIRFYLVRFLGIGQFAMIQAHQHLFPFGIKENIQRGFPVNPGDTQGMVLGNFAEGDVRIL